MQTIEDFKNHIPQIGRLEWIGIAAAKRAEMSEVQEASLQADTGIEGEHHATTGSSKRQVTLIQSEHLPVVAEILQNDQISPARLRRNLVVSGINLLALKDREFRIGHVRLKGTGPCAPCSRMEDNLGPGGYNAMRGHGGITAVVLEGGRIEIGSVVAFSPETSET